MIDSGIVPFPALESSSRNEGVQAKRLTGFGHDLVIVGCADPLDCLANSRDYGILGNTASSPSLTLITGIRISAFQDPLRDHSLCRFRITHIWKYMEVIELLRKLRKHTKKYLMKNQASFKHLFEDSVLRFSMICDFCLSLLILASFPATDYYGAFICSIGSSLQDLEGRICTPVPFFDQREQANAQLPPVTFPSLQGETCGELNLSVLSNLQFLLSCIRICTRNRDLTPEDARSKDSQVRQFEEVSNYLGGWIQKANRKEIRIKRQQRMKDKERKRKLKSLLQHEYRSPFSFTPHYLNHDGVLYPLNAKSSPYASLSSSTKSHEAVPKPKPEEVRESRLIKIDSNLDDSGTIVSSVIGEDFSVRMLTKQMIKFTLAISPESDSFTNSFIWNEFVPHRKCKLFQLSEGATKIQVEPNAGGNSYHSEILSFEILKRAFNAQLVNTEMELEYYPFNSKKTDYSCIMADSIFGISVTRAMKFGSDDEFTIEDAVFLLKKKLFGIIISSKNVIKSQRWKKQILHIWCASKQIAVIIQHVWKMFKNPDHTYHHLTSDTIIMCTIASKSPYIFHGREELPAIAEKLPN